MPDQIPTTTLNLSAYSNFNMVVIQIDVQPEIVDLEKPMNPGPEPISFDALTPHALSNSERFRTISP